MNERQNIFTSENIISTLGIKIDDSLECELDYSNGSFAIASKFLVKNKNNDDVYFEADNYEDTAAPCFLGRVKTVLDKNGQVTTAIDIDNEQMKTIVKVCNRYLKVYRLMYDIKEFGVDDTVYLSFLADYLSFSPLTLEKLTCSRISLVSNHMAYGPLETNVNAFVNEFLGDLNIKFLDENTDMDALYPLVEMQKTIKHMERI
jgi:hypothetical protein